MEIEENKWTLVRTNNGEWISEVHIEILSEDEFKLFEILADEEGNVLDKHYGYYETGEQFVWCYKNDISHYKSNETISFTKEFQDRITFLADLTKRQGAWDYSQHPSTMSLEEIKAQEQCHLRYILKRVFDDDEEVEKYLSNLEYLQKNKNTN